MTHKVTQRPMWQRNKDELYANNLTPLYYTAEHTHTYTDFCEVKLNLVQVSKDLGFSFSAIKRIIATLLLTVSVSVSLIDEFNKSHGQTELRWQKYPQHITLIVIFAVGFIKCFATKMKPSLDILQWKNSMYFCRQAALPGRPDYL